MRLLSSVLVFVLMVFSINAQALPHGKTVATGTMTFGEEGVGQVLIGDKQCHLNDKPYFRKGVVLRGGKPKHVFCWAYSHDSRMVILISENTSDPVYVSHKKIIPNAYGNKFITHYYNKFGGNPLSDYGSSGNNSGSSGSTSGNGESVLKEDTDPDENQF